MQEAYKPSKHDKVAVIRKGPRRTPIFPTSITIIPSTSNPPPLAISTPRVATREHPLSCSYGSNSPPHPAVAIPVNQPIVHCHPPSLGCSAHNWVLASPWILFIFTIWSLYNTSKSSVAGDVCLHRLKCHVNLRVCIPVHTHIRVQCKQYLCDWRLY
jgi:hypothetical protein